MELKGKTCLITGGLRGIGLALAKEASKRQAKLVLVQRSEADKETLKELEDLGALEVHTFSKDLSEAKSIDELVNELKEKNIEVDLLINNAGLLTGGLIENQDSEQIVKMLDVNLKGLILLTKALLPGMLERKHGKIVNNSSVSGVMCIPCASTYAAAKSGVVAFTECIRQELKDTGVSTLIMFTPGIETNMYKEIEKLYGDHIDLDFLTSQPPEEWAKTVFEAIDEDQEVVKPSGSTRVGLWLSKHFPKIFEGQIQKYFKRDK